MYKFIVEIFHVKLFGSCSYVPILVPITFLVTVYTCQAYIATDIKFAFLIEEGHNVLLKDMGTRSTHLIDCIFTDNLFNFLQTLNHLNTSTSISIFPRFNKPSISFLSFKPIFKLFLFLLLLFLLYNLSSSFIFFLKSTKLFIIYIGHMECHRDIFKWVYFLSLVIIF